MATTYSRAAAAALIAALLGVGAAWLVRSRAEPSTQPSEVATPTPVEAPPSTVPPEPETSPTESAEFASLRWFREHQEADGRWRDPATTGVVVMAFLGAGETHSQGSSRDRDVVKKALGALCAGQDAEGRLASRTSPTSLRDHAIAGLALTESFGMTGDRGLKAPAQRAVEFALRSRRPDGAWGRTSPSGDETDVETTVWMSMLVKSAQISEFDVEKTALARVAEAVDRLVDPATGRVRVPSPSDELSADAEMAAALVVKAFAGRRPETDAALAAAINWLVAGPPTIDAMDLPYVHFSRITMLHFGGEGFRRWLPGLVAFVQSPCVRNGPNQGSWDPPGGGGERERIWATAYHLFAGGSFHGAVAHAPR